MQYMQCMQDYQEIVTVRIIVRAEFLGRAGNFYVPLRVFG
jgi:hypothetical protein